jgi:hypothetical protein
MLFKAPVALGSSDDTPLTHKDLKSALQFASVLAYSLIYKHCTKTQIEGHDVRLLLGKIKRPQFLLPQSISW